MSSLEENAASLKVQKHQLEKTSEKIGETTSSVKKLFAYESETSQRIDRLLLEIDEVDVLLSNSKMNLEFDEVDRLLDSLNDLEDIGAAPKLSRVEALDIQKIVSEDMSWNEYVKLVNDYACINNINLSNPFKGLLNPSQEVELRNRIKDEFTYKNANCDRYDYLIAGTSGVLCGLLDSVFVGAPKDSVLGEKVDEFAGSATEKFAKFLGWNQEKAIENGSNTTASAIGFLERKFKVNYDQATTASVGGAVKNLSLKNHHLKSLSHSPDIIGLFFSIINQFTNTSSFASNGEIITVDTETFELQGNDFVSKIFSGIANWFGHIMSDWAGSSGTVGQGGRGTGVPIPFYNLFLLMDFGEIGQDKQTFATVVTKVFEQGYDFRHGLTMAIPVVLNEIIIRLCWTLKARFYHHKDWKECIPKDSNPELRRMLLVGHGSLCIIDGIDAYIRGVDNPVATLLRVNLIGWVRFSHLALKELNALYNQGKIDHDAIDAYLDGEFQKLSMNFR